MRCVSSLEARDPGLRAILSRYLFQRGTRNLRSRQLSIFYRSKNLLFLETLLRDRNNTDGGFARTAFKDPWGETSMEGRYLKIRDTREDIFQRCVSIE